MLWAGDVFFVVCMSGETSAAESQIADATDLMARCSNPSSVAQECDVVINVPPRSPWPRRVSLPGFMFELLSLASECGTMGELVKRLQLPNTGT